MSPLTVTLIQTNLQWEDKGANLSMLQKKISAIKEKTEVVVLPEMFTTGFSMRPALYAETMQGETIEWMKNIAASNNIILTGSVIIEEEHKYFNRLIWMQPNGEYGYYDKRHLFAHGDEHLYYTPGNKRLIASVKGWKINLQVCYDLRFPMWARQSPYSAAALSTPWRGAGGEVYDILLYVANWPERRINAWKTLLQARAIENQCYVIGVNRVGNDGNNVYHTGDSMVVNAMGETLYHKTHKEEIFTITLQKDELEETRNKLPFLKDADKFFIAD